MEFVIWGHLELKDADTVRTDLLAGTNLADLLNETLNKFLEAACISHEEVANAKSAMASIEIAPHDEAFATAIGAAILAIKSNKFDAALRHFDEALKLIPDHASIRNNRDVAPWHLDRYEEALALRPDLAGTGYNRGVV